MPTIVITGAAGVIGRAVAPLLAAENELRFVDIRIPDDEADWPGAWTRASVTDHDALRSVMDGADLLVHLAGIPTEAPWADLLAANIDGTRAILETAHATGVRRVMLASSIHAAGYRPGSQADVDGVRPDTYYGVTKVAVEALGSLFADRFDMSIVSARICTFGADPAPGRPLATWLSPADMARLITAAAGLDKAGHHIVWAVSDNAPRWFSLEAGHAIGFIPVDDAVSRLKERTDADLTFPDASDPMGGSLLTVPLGVRFPAQTRSARSRQSRGAESTREAQD